jgi:moderate conductance mechanosensitive channel
MPPLEQWFSDPDSWASVGSVVFQLAVLVVATLVALRFTTLTVRAAVGRLFAREAREGTAREVSAVEIQRRRETLEGLLNRALRVAILVIAFVMAIAVLGLDVTAAIAGLGIVGLALSLGAQHLVRDYVAGAFVLIENQYSKGDIVSIAGVTGTVEDVSLRRTSLRDLDGTLHTVPHGLIQVASNLTRRWARINLDVPVPYDEDQAAVTAAIHRAATGMADDPEWRAHVFKVPRVVRIEQLAEAGLVLKVLGTVAATHRFEAAGELRGRIKEECDKAGLILGWRPVPAERSPREGGDQR